MLLKLHMPVPFWQVTSDLLYKAGGGIWIDIQQSQARDGMDFYPMIWKNIA